MRNSKKHIDDSSIILVYVTIITGLYPLFMLPDKISHIFNLGQFNSVVLHYLSVFVFFFLIPAVIIKFIFHKNLREYGLNFFNLKKGIIFIGIVLPILFVSIWVSSFQSPFQMEYPLAKAIIYNRKLFIVMEFFYLLYYVGWEFLFRGFIIFGLKKYGILVPIAIETSISTILHYTKPGGEIFLALIAGFLLGYYTYKYKTIWFAVLLHWSVGILMDLFTSINR